MPIGKLLKRSGAPTSQTGEWAEARLNSDIDSLTYASVDAVIPARRVSQVVKVPLSGATIHAGTGGVVAWAIPSTCAIMIERVVLDVTTAATDGVCTLDIGYTASSATTTSDSLLDGVDVGAGVAVYDSMNAALDSGANAKAQKGAAGKWITIDEKTGDATGLVANLYIHYTAI